MTRVVIGNSERTADQAKMPWLKEQIESRRRDGVPVCVRVFVQSDSVDIVLATPGCSSSGGSSRPLTSRENQLVELWNKRGMNMDSSDIGQLNAFLNEIKHI